MTDCTEWQAAAPGDGLAGKGQQGMSRPGPDMTGMSEEAQP
jgi:hypothetical protein